MILATNYHDAVSTPYQLPFRAWPLLTIKIFPWHGPSVWFIQSMIHDPTEEEAIHCEYTVSKPCNLVLIYSTLNCTPLTGRSRELT